MDFELTTEQRAWRDEIRQFLAENVTPALLRELAQLGSEARGPELREFRRKVGERGWYGLGWPKEFGGLGRGAIDQHMLHTECLHAGVPGPDFTVTSMAPMIMRYGTEQNKAEFLPGIARGEIFAAIGYSEPSAGTDLASLRTRAELDGDEWVINGSKIWNSFAHSATHEWLLVRTDRDAPKHKGLSVIMVPIDTPGIDVRPLTTWADWRINETFFVDVRVPKSNLIGEVNQGWKYVTGALDLERGAMLSSGDLRREYELLLDFCKRHTLDGVRPVEHADVRSKLAALAADIEVARLMGMAAASRLEMGEIPSTLISAEKIFLTELRQRLADYGTQILGAYGQLHWENARAPFGGAMERLYRFAPPGRFGGGTNEVIRDIIAQRGYGMPNYGRASAVAPRKGAETKVGN
ncbi:acyl-CoA dehydrogenase family protein [Rhodanobacter lindaniclasticus]